MVYMGLASAAAVRDGLIEAGRDPATPAAVLARGTRPDFARRGRPSRRSSQARRRRRRRPGAARHRRGGRALGALARSPRIPECTGGRMTSPHEQKKRKVNGSVVVTANRLGDGAVVYRTVERRLDHRPRVGRGGGGAGRGGAAAARGSRRRARGRPLYRAGRARARTTACCRAICASASGLPGPTFALPGACGLRPDNVPLRRFRPDAGRPARLGIPRSGAPPALRRADRGRVQAPAADERRLSAAPRLHAADRHPLRHAVLEADAHAHTTTPSQDPAPDERRLSAAARLYAADRDPLRHAVVRADAHAGACGAPLRPRLRPFHHPAEHPVQLDQARGDAGHARRSRQRQDARHADHRQLRAQHHHRPVGRRRGRRDRGSAHLGGGAAPAFDAASGILVPAAQVQDRDHRRRARPRRGQGPRHRPADASATARARSASR